MNEEVERRIEEARLEAERAKETKEFLESLTRNDDLIKPIYSPEAFILRDKMKAAAKRGEIPKKNCRHPMRAIAQYKDDDPTIARNGKDVNLFVCTACETHLWLIDPWGAIVSDS